MNANKNNIYILGRGRVGWHRNERVVDCYGMIGIFEDGAPADSKSVDLDVTGLIGKKGKLRAVILEARESRHIGDVFHNIGPRPVRTGDIVELGVGMLAMEDFTGDMRIGVVPADGREHFWLHPQYLYDCHDQVVRLEFVEGDLQMKAWFLDA